MTRIWRPALVQARCDNGHLQRWWSSPLMVAPGETVRVRGNLYHCHCGAVARGPQ